MKVWTSEGVLIKSSFTFTWLAFPNELIDFQRYHLLDAEATRLVAKPESFHGLAQSLDGTDRSLPNDAAWSESDVSFRITFYVGSSLWLILERNCVLPAG